MRLRMALIALSAVTLLASCGSSAGSKSSSATTTVGSPAAGRPDVCALLTRQEAQDAMGVSTSAPQDNGGGPMTDPKGNLYLCNMHGDGIVDLSLFVGADEAAAQAYYATKSSATAPRYGSIIKGNEVVSVDLQIELEPAGLKGKTQAEIDTHYREAVKQILKDAKARLRG